jgi:hypothetical protein
MKVLETWSEKITDRDQSDQRYVFITISKNIFLSFFFVALMIYVFDLMEHNL